MNFKKAQELVKYVGEKNQHTQNNNTEMVIYCIEEIANRRGYNIAYDDIWIEVKSILRTSGYNIQSIMRERYEIFGSSSEQEKHADLYHYNYSK